jgi:hypothetical protein
MFALYKHQGAIILDDILNDIMLILTGETDINNLSGTCDPSVSYIKTDISTSPWTLWDDHNGTEKILRVEQSDDSGRYKYIGLKHNSGITSSARIAFTVMESWDNGAHTGTNELAADYDKQKMGVYLAQPPSAFGNHIYIYASEFALIIMAVKYDNDFGDEGGDATYGSTGIWECSRDAASMAAGDMPNWFIAPSGIFGGDADITMDCFAWQGRNKSDSVVTPMRTSIYVPGRAMDNHGSGQGNYVTGDRVVRYEEDLAAHATHPKHYVMEHICIGANTHNAGGVHDYEGYLGSVSERCDIWALPEGGPRVLDIMIAGGQKYITLKAGHTASASGQIVGKKFVVPYG